MGSHWSARCPAGHAWRHDERREHEPRTQLSAEGTRISRLGAHRLASTAERSLRDLISMKGDVEYGTTLITLAKAEPLVRRAQTLVDLAKRVARPTH